MGQPFDVKRFEANEKRKVILREYATLPQSTKDNLLTIIGLEGKRSNFFQSCITCEHWDTTEPLDPNQQAVERCKKFNMRPPAAIIVDGCEHYIDFDEVPF